MNAVEIEQAVSDLFDKPFEAGTFVPEFLEAFGNKTTVIKRLQSSTSLSDIEGAVLQRSNIHLKVCAEGLVHRVFNQLKASPATSKNKVKYVLATDGITVEAEDLSGNEPFVCEYKDFPNHFGYFLPLAGIETVKQIRDSSFDIRATSRLNRLYVELLKENPSWGTAENSHQMNHFMARLIFCFFAEDTDIFRGNRLFTTTVEQMSERDSGNTHQVISEIFRALNTKPADRGAEKLPRWTESFPYVNGGLFAGSVEVPKFSKIARSYLLHIGSLDWTKINPDIFGSMIQAVADEEERGALGMHYTSVPNILKVLNPLFLDHLREQLEGAGDNARTLLNLRKRISKIRVFDPACGSGNFLVIAYKQMREIENEINVRRGEVGRKSDIPLTNFRGIELRDFAAEIARLALIIAEYQCDLLYRGQKEAIDDFLPLDSQNWITCGNALVIDWLSLCPPTGVSVKLQSGDLFETPLDQAQIDFENEGGETYICGNPPYKGSQSQDDSQKQDLEKSIALRVKNWKSLDYVAGWFIKAAEYSLHCDCGIAFVSTNSVCQGRQVEPLWGVLFSMGLHINFAHTSFKWQNLASHNAGVTVVVVGLSNKKKQGACKIYTSLLSGEILVKNAENINAYLVPGDSVIVKQSANSISNLPEMVFGNMANDGGYLLLSVHEKNEAIFHGKVPSKFIRHFVGSQELIRGQIRYCIWVTDNSLEEVVDNEWLREKFDLVAKLRSGSNRNTTKELAAKPYKFGEIRQNGDEVSIIIPAVSSSPDSRPFLPVGYVPQGSIVSNLAFAIFDGPLWCISLIASRIHFVWISAVCGQLGTSLRYSNTIGWNTFPLPSLTEKNKADLTKCAEGILLARELHFPATIADLYEPDSMPQNLKDAHERNDEVLERIYIGRRFKNDTERLEKLFELYAKMTGKK